MQLRSIWCERMIRIPKDAYEKFLRFALENANPYHRKNWKECIGLILGRISSGNSILITDIVPIGAGSAVFVAINDYEKVFSLISVSRIDQGEVIVGWAHTHPGLGLFLSSTDINTQQLYQRMHSKAFALVLDPTKIASDFPGFNIFRLDNTLSNSIIIEYEFDEEFNYQNLKEKLSTELYPIPLIPSAIPQILSTEKSVTWKDITLRIDGPTEAVFDRPFEIKIAITLPFRQFVRVDYHLETDDFAMNPISSKLISSNKLFHETLTSGILGIFTFHPKKVGETTIRMKSLTLADCQHHFQKMPEIGLRTFIEKE